MATRAARLTRLQEEMKKDASLPLKKGATNLVFGVGDPETDVLFIGEGPGYWEDQKAEPFVGNAGKFLDQLLQTIKLPREEVYITNIVHHRPPDNRDPEPGEIEAYGKYLDELIKIVDPKVIVTLGRFSMAKFLPGVFISSVHGKPKEVVWEGKKITVVPMYHPAAGLRNGQVRQQTMRDFLIIPEVLEDKAESEGQDLTSEQMKLV